MHEPPAAPAPSRDPARWLWPALAAAAALLAFFPAFSTSRIFYVTDTSFYWWPKHLWFRDTVFSGRWPWWDPYLAYGQSAVADPSRQLFFPPLIALRLLLPDVIGFNASVALPFPLAALGTWLFLRRHVSPPAATLGALVFALCGPVLSAASMLNNAWTLAFIPWLLHAVDRVAERPSGRRVTVLAVGVCLQLLVGEPVSFAAAQALALAYALLATPLAAATRRARVTAAGLTLAGQGAGLMLAAVQLLPLVDATRRSARGSAEIADIQPVHPLSLAEAVAYPLFGDTFASWPDPSPWLKGLNDGFNPYLLSLYFGPAALAFVLAGTAGVVRRGWDRFWGAALVVSLVCALGPHTPVYPALKAALPMLQLFRYPSKYAYVAAFAAAVLAALGWDAVLDRARPRARRLALGLLLTLAAVGVLVWIGAEPAVTAEAWPRRLAEAHRLADPTRAARVLADGIATAAPRLALVAGVAAACLWLAAGMLRRRPWAEALLMSVVAFDLLAVNTRLNPTLDVRFFREPPWAGATREHPQDRFHAPGRISWLLGPGYEEGIVRTQPLPPAVSTQGTFAITNSLFAAFPSPWRLREAITVDQNVMWPREYLQMMREFGTRPEADRVRFLRRTGVRYFLAGQSPPGARPRAYLAGFAPMALYEGPPPMPRAFMVTAARVVPDIDAQTRRLFEPGFDPAAEVLLAAAPPVPAGASGTAGPPSAAIARDEPGEVVAHARAPEGGGYLVLLDTYDTHWRVEVDGVAAPLLRADGLFRAVRLAPGPHEVRFRYRPRPLLAGAVLSLATAMGLGLLASRWRPARLT